MKNEQQESHPESINAQLASHLRTNKGDILSDWVQRVRSDPSIKTEGLSRLSLEDHVPTILDDLVRALNQYGSDSVANRAVKDADIHGETRWEQGFSLSELLGETKHLRTAMIQSLIAFEEANPQFGMAARLFIATTVHTFLDDMVIEASEEFVKFQGFAEFFKQQERTLKSS